MMECDKAKELLPWFVNGSLSKQEADSVSRHLEGCAECRRELSETGAAFEIFGEHLPAGVLVELAFEGTTGPIPRRLVDRHLAACGRCSEELALVRESRAELGRAEAGATRGAAEAESGSGSAGRRGNLVGFPTGGAGERVWRALAMAASIAALVASGGWIWSWQQDAGQRDPVADIGEPNETRAAASRLAELEGENRRLAAEREELSRRAETGDTERDSLLTRLARLAAPQVNVPIVDIYPREMVLRGADSGGKDSGDEVFEIPVGVPTVTLILNSQLARERSVSCRLVDPKGEVAWRADGLEGSDDGGGYSLSFSTTELEPGGYTLLLVDGSTGDELESYALLIG